MRAHLPLGPVSSGTGSQDDLVWLQSFHGSAGVVAPVPKMVEGRGVHGRTGECVALRQRSCWAEDSIYASGSINQHSR